MEKRLLELKEKTEALQTQNDYLGTCLVWDDGFLGLQWEWRGKKYDLMNFLLFKPPILSRWFLQNSGPRVCYFRAFQFFYMYKDGFFLNEKSWFFGGWIPSSRFAGSKIRAWLNFEGLSTSALSRYIARGNTTLAVNPRMKAIGFFGWWVKLVYDRSQIQKLARQKTKTKHVSSDQNPPNYWLFIGDYTTQLYKHWYYDKPL